MTCACLAWPPAELPKTAATGWRAVTQQVRTGPGRSSKARASRSWRNAGSDAEDEDIILDDDDDSPVARPRRGGGISPAGEAAGGSGTTLAGLDDEDGDEGLGEGEELDAEDAMDVDGAMDGAGGEAGGAGDGSPHGSPEEGAAGERRLSGGGAEEVEAQPPAAGPTSHGEEQEENGGRDAAGGLVSAHRKHLAAALQPARGCISILILQGCTNAVHEAKASNAFSQASTRLQPSPSPGQGAGRRGGARSSRSGGGGIVGDGGLAQDECLSPLHMLGEAAMSESQGDLVSTDGDGYRTRKNVDYPEEV